jgi:hypothetical protein
MGRMIKALASFYRRWKYVEDDSTAAEPQPGSEEGEASRLRRAIEREERLLADYRRNGCPALARERESTLRSLRNRLTALDLDLRRAI